MSALRWPGSGVCLVRNQILVVNGGNIVLAHRPGHRRGQTQESIIRSSPLDPKQSGPSIDPIRPILGRVNVAGTVRTNGTLWVYLQSRGIIQCQGFSSAPEPLLVSNTANANTIPRVVLEYSECEASECQHVGLGQLVCASQQVALRDIRDPRHMPGSHVSRIVHGFLSKPR